MANWVENLLIIKNVSSKRLAEIRSKFAGTEANTDRKNKNKGIIQRTIDFRKICPIPAELNIEDSSLGEEGYEILNKIMTFEESMDPDNAPNLEEKFREHCNEMSEKEIKKAFQLGKQYYLNFREFGCMTAVDWCYDNWGTKSNSIMAISISENELFFLTAWEPPLGIIMLLGAEFKDAQFELSYSSENGEAGVYIINGDNETHDFSEFPPDKLDDLRVKLRKMKHSFEEFPN